MQDLVPRFKHLNLPIQTILIGQGLRANARELIRPLHLGGKLAVIGDENTLKILGLTLAESMNADIIQLPGTPKPDEPTAAWLQAKMAEFDGIVAVGSGTLNDLCKYVSHRLGKPYAVFATAPSMNGYTSISASIIENNEKHSLNAHLPRGIFFELDIVASAPSRLIVSGLGDSLCRPTAQADWLLSHLLLDTPYRKEPFKWLMEEEGAFLHSTHLLRAGDKEAVARLCRILITAGVGMTVCGGSYPASQGEHQVAHYMESVYGDRMPQSFHGEQIGVTTLTMAKLQAFLLEKYAEHSPKLIKQSSKIKDQDLFAHTLETRWPEIRRSIGHVTVAPKTLRRTLEEAGAPITPQALGWKPEWYQDAVRNAWSVRNRFGFLDLAHLTGDLEDFINGFTA